MQKVYIRGVRGRGKEVIAKLEALGGKNIYNTKGDDPNAFYLINQSDEITHTNYDVEMSAIAWSGTEIFLDEPKPEPESVNILKMYDPVMVSNDGKRWDVGFYESEDYVTIGADIERRISYCFDYIVPLFDFDFNDIESNIKRSVV